MVEILHNQGSRVTFWITSFINPESENYQEARGARLHYEPPMEGGVGEVEQRTHRR